MTACYVTAPAPTPPEPWFSRCASDPDILIFTLNIGSSPFFAHF
jgi:hypothetical protein